MTNLFASTLHQAPADAVIASHQLLLRAGYIDQLATGIYSYLPLGLRSIRKLENIIREEMDAIGGIEVAMPVIHPARLWQETGRWYSVDAEMGRFKDRNDHDLVLAMTHEEIATDLARQFIQSYKQLPRLIYQFQTKWRDDPRPRGGLIRTREFIMKDSYSMDANWEGLDQQYRSHYQAYFNIFNRCDLDVIAVKSDTGMMGGKIAHEFMVLTEIGEDTILLCENCDYAANRQIATASPKSYPGSEPLALQKVATPDCKTIDDVANFLEIPTWQTAKAVFFVARVKLDSEIIEKFVFVVIRGDLEVNETKLAALINAVNLRPAMEAEISAVGAVAGYASPIGLENVLIVADDSIVTTPNLVSGANEIGYHYKNVNYGRDFSASLIGDITAVNAGDACIVCQSPLQAERAVEVGNIFKYGSWMSEKMGATYQDEAGTQQPVIMGSYGIGVGRLLATVAEIHNDEFGLCLPISVAPFQVHMVSLAGRSGQEITTTADEIYAQLIAAGIEVLYDDRPESPGVKFSDADLIGIPIRLTISQRSMKNGGVELKDRSTGDLEILPLENLLERIQDFISAKQSKLLERIVEVEYSD
ncbi:MAG: proline--tRNA ligase [Anaerolineales bacterium]